MNSATGKCRAIVLTPTEDSSDIYATIPGDLADILNWLSERCKQTKTPLPFASGGLL